MNTTNTNMPSLCIPRVFPNIDEKRIRKIFDELQIGNIERIDIINKQTEKGEKYNRVFIHFNLWYNNSNANQVRDRLLNGKDIKIIYDDPWFWKVSAYRGNNQSNKIENKSYNNHKNNHNTKPVIIMDDYNNNKNNNRNNNINNNNINNQKLSASVLPVTVFKPRVLINKSIKNVKIQKKIDENIELPPKKQNCTTILSLTNPSHLKLEEDEEEI
jgi:hypothetical protein